MRRIIPLKAIGFAFIGLFCFLYSLFGSVFAKMQVKLSFLKFPIFIGEVMLGVCALLYFLQRIREKRWQRWDGFLVAYLVFVLAKAFYGYHEYGPLALRHTVLFCYPLFVVFVINFYQKEIFSSQIFSIPVSVVILFLLILALTALPVLKEFTLTYILLALSLIVAYPVPSTRILMLLMLALTPSFKLLFCTSRAFLVANVAACIFLIVVLCLWAPIRNKYKIVFAFLLIVGFAGLVNGLADKDSVKSFTHAGSLVSRYKEFQEYIDEQKEIFVMQPLGKINLFNPPEKKELTPFLQAPAAVQKAGKRSSTGPVQVDRGSSNVSLAREVKGAALPAKVVTLEPSPSFSKEKNPSAIAAAQGTNQGSSSDAGQVDRISPNVSLAREVKGAALPAKVETLEPSPSFSREKNPPAIAAAQGTNQGSSSDARQVDRVSPNVLMAGKEVRAVSSPAVELEVRSVGYPQEENPPADAREKFEKSLPNWSEEENFMHTSISWIDFAKVYEFKKSPPVRASFDTSNTNILFRVFIWKDILEDICLKPRPGWQYIFGFDFGRPFRSKNLEILGWARGEWERDGWICPHNSYLEIIYRTGVVGLLLILFLGMKMVELIRIALSGKSIIGILMCGIVVNWLVGAFFSVTFELPYFAIPFWSLLGMAFAYMENVKRATHENSDHS